VELYHKDPASVVIFNMQVEKYTTGKDFTAIKLYEDDPFWGKRYITIFREKNPKVKSGVTYDAEIWIDMYGSDTYYATKTNSYPSWLGQAAEESSKKLEKIHKEFYPESENKEDNKSTNSEKITPPVKPKPPQNGFGKFTYDNGDVYEGNWINGKRHGKGKYDYADGISWYDGEWVDDKKEGYGTEHYPDNDEYKGYFKNGKRNGKGIYKYVNGDIYDGNFTNSIRTGKGKYTWKKSGNVYDGDWLNDVINGKGIKTFSNGDVYDGNWVKGKKSGYGTEKLKNGIEYIGNFENDLRNGHGEITHGNGDVYNGNFVNDIRSGKGKYTWSSSGNVYDGNWEKGNREGFGIFYYKNGNKYAGSWKENIKSGQGNYTYLSGDVYEGKWQNDKREGEFKATLANGRIVNYTYKDGEIVGEVIVKTADNFEGIGIAFSFNSESQKYLITLVGDNTPAKQAGLMANDVMLSADGQTLSDKSMNEVVALIKGPSGSSVILQIERNGQTKTIEVKRGKITAEDLYKQE